jgi:ketosteroid isomerase-like protein
MADLRLMIREYYKAFNERRLQDSAAMFTDDAVIQHRPRSEPLKGPDGYIASAHQAFGTFPDLQLEVLQIEQRGDTIFDVDVSATGTHVGDWTAESLGTLKATGQTKTFRIREMLEIRGGKITFSGLTYDMRDLIG